MIIRTIILLVSLFVVVNSNAQVTTAGAKAVPASLPLEKKQRFELQKKQLNDFKDTLIRQITAYNARCGSVSSDNPSLENECGSKSEKLENKKRYLVRFIAEYNHELGVEVKAQIRTIMLRVQKDEHPIDSMGFGMRGQAFEEMERYTNGKKTKLRANAVRSVIDCSVDNIIGKYKTNKPLGKQTTAGLVKQLKSAHVTTPAIRRAIQALSVQKGTGQFYDVLLSCRKAIDDTTINMEKVDVAGIISIMKMFRVPLPLDYLIADPGMIVDDCYDIVQQNILVPGVDKLCSLTLHELKALHENNMLLEKDVQELIIAQNDLAILERD